MQYKPLTGRTAFCGPTGSGKSTLLYEHLTRLAENGARRDQILLLVPGAGHRGEWRDRLSAMYPLEPAVATFNSFIRSELTVYYPILLKNCPKILKKRNLPLFLGSEAARFILYRAVDIRRNRKLLFGPVAADSMQIAEELCFSIARAANQGIAFEEIGPRLAAARGDDAEAVRSAYRESEELLEAYRTKCLELGAVDQGLSVYLYRNCLLPDEAYRETLFKRYRQLAADNLEEFTPAGAELIGSLAAGVETAAFACNTEACEAWPEGAGYEALSSLLLASCEVRTLSGSYTCSPQIYRFADSLYAALTGASSEEPEACGALEKAPPCELRSEMLEAAADRVIRLVREEGYRPSDIAMLSTFADPVTEYLLEGILNRRGLKIRNLSRDRKFSENPYTRSLLTLARICNPSLGLFPGRDNVRLLLDLLFDIDPVSRSALAAEILAATPAPRFPRLEELKSELPGEEFGPRYELIREKLEELSEKRLALDEFFRRAFMDILISPAALKEHIREVRRLAETAGEFIDAVDAFGRNGSRDYLEMAGSGLFATGRTDMEAGGDGDEITLATPASILRLPVSYTVMVLLSASSRNWTPAPGGSLANAAVLAGEWEAGRRYDGGIDERLRRSRLGSRLRCVLKRCAAKLIVFESELSSAGYENDGILSACLDEAAGGE